MKASQRVIFFTIRIYIFFYYSLQKVSGKLLLYKCFHCGVTEPQKVNCLILLLKHLHHSFTEMIEFNSLIQSRKYQCHYFEIVA